MENLSVFLSKPSTVYKKLWIFHNMNLFGLGFNKENLFRIPSYEEHMLK